MQKVYSQILQIAGDVITVEAEGVSYKEIAEVKTKAGTSLAQAKACCALAKCTITG